MESLAAPLPESVPIDLQRLKRACETAVAAAARAENAAAAIDAALGALHDELDEAGVAAFVLEHGRLWSVGVRGYAMIPDGLPIDEGVVGRAVCTSSVQLVVDVAADPDFVEISRGVASEIAIPLVMPTGVVGVINIETTTRLPEGAEAVVGSLARALAEPMDELRVSRTVDLSSLARLFVYMSSLARPACDLRSRSEGTRPRAARRDEPVAACRRERPAGRVDASGAQPAAVRSRCLAARCRRCGSGSTHLRSSSCSTRARCDVPELDGARARSVVLIPLRANGAEIGLLAGDEPVRQGVRSRAG